MGGARREIEGFRSDDFGAGVRSKAGIVPTTAGLDTGTWTTRRDPPDLAGGIGNCVLSDSMLNLKSTTSDRWLRQVDEHLDEILIDHAHCEKKAAGCALNLMFAYIENIELCREMTTIVKEELDHFHLVCDLLNKRGIRFRRLKPGNYGCRLHELTRKFEPQRAVDRLLIAALIEARSCERFELLRDHVEDAELSRFYGDLFESEARHHSTYVRLAKSYASDSEVHQRLQELALDESRIIEEGHALPRMHS
jgi:tRNA 2-(methylsulfanyl)-N6-isopentenyladenosine37 hydroxylase